MELKQKDREMYEDYCMIYVWRNSNDFAFRGSVGTGSKVFNCDNMALIAEWVVGAKHTLNVYNMLASRLDTLNETLKEQGQLMHEKYNRYKNTTIGQPIADHIVFKAVRDQKLLIYEPNFRRNYIHINDVVAGILYSIKNFNRLKANVYNLGLSSANLTKYNLAKKIKKQISSLKIKIVKNRKYRDQ